MISSKKEETEKEKQEIIKLKNPKEIFFIGYKSFHKILYDVDECLNISSENLEKDLGQYFYLALLIKDNIEINNYQYSFKIIEDLDNFSKESKGKFNEIIIVKIIEILIDNYELSDVKDNENINLNEIKEKNEKRIDEAISTIKNDKVFENIKFKSESFEELYAYLIINVLIKSGNIEEKNEEEKNFTKIFINQLDLENVELTENIYKEIATFFNRPNDKYKISNHNDLNDEKKINFFYNLFKYILKKNIYIYNIDFLNQTRKNIIQIIRGNYFTKNNNIDNEKFKYVIEFLTDTKYYYEKYFNQKTVIHFESTYNLSIMNVSNSEENQSRLNSLNLYGSKEKRSSSNDFQYQAQNQNNLLLQVNNNYNENNYLYNYENEGENENLSDSFEDKYKILKFKKYIMRNEYKNSKTKLVITLSDGHYIRVDYNEYIFIYDKNYNEKLKFNFQNINFILNIIEYDRNDCSNQKINILIIVFDHFYYYILDKNNISNALQSSHSPIKNEHNCHNYFKLASNINNNDIFLISGKSGIYKLEKINNEYKESNLAKGYFINSIKITDNLYAFSSNQIFDKGDNIIKIYDTNEKDSRRKNNVIEIKKEQEYSFTSCKNGLCVIDIDDNYKLLLCACTRYTQDKEKAQNENEEKEKDDIQKNGILMIKIDVKNFIIIFKHFEETEDFEVNCFCKIYESDDKKFVYFLVGGFEFNKKRGMIKLYKITFGEKEVKLDYIQDAIEDYDLLDDNDFDGMIFSIIKSKDNKRDIIVSCLEGSNYLFSLPKDDNYFKDL